MNIDLTLISHTNVGKTSLARTLLQRDIGQTLDQAHVTDTSDCHELLSTPAGDALLLWDTPGLGDSARLLKRLARSGDPVGWLMTQVWDRWVDRPLYSSQMAIRAVRERCDVALYLVNASEGPASAAYVGIEMQIVGWLGKPVLVLLNQTGPPRAGDDDLRDEAAWRTHLAGYPWVKGTLSLDAFSRVWVQEDVLLEHVAGCLPPDKRAVFDSLRAEWRRRNLEAFDASMACAARQLAESAIDQEPIAARGWTHGMREWLTTLSRDRQTARPPAHVATAMDALAKRAEAGARACTQQLIRLHGLSGEASGQIETRLAAHFTRNEAVDPAKAGLLGAVLTGALGGLAADLAAGGLTIGAGALVGGVLGLLGASGAATTYNVVRGGGEPRVGWSADFQLKSLESAVLRYLAVAHFGRGRGRWVASEYPAHWPATVHARAAAHSALYLSALSDACDTATDGTRNLERCVSRLQSILRSLVIDVLTELYPHAAAMFGGTGQTDTHPPVHQ